MPGAEPSAAQGLGAHGPSLCPGLEGQEGCVSTQRLCLGSCLRQVSWSCLRQVSWSWGGV